MQNKYSNRMFSNLLLDDSSSLQIGIIKLPIGTIKMLIGTNNWGIETYRNKLENIIVNQLFFKKKNHLFDNFFRCQHGFYCCW